MQKPANDTAAPQAVSPATDKNRDPITKQPGAHAVGVGIGAVGAGAAAGAVGGAVAGPVGAAVGAVAGAVAGGVVGKAAAEVVNPTVEEKYWHDNHAASSYADAANGYDQYAPAYRYGWESAGRSSTPGQTFESAESALERGWDKAKGGSRLAWNKARDATREAWNRVHRA